MASYEVTGADGQIYDIEGPEGASDQEIIAAVKRQIAEENPLPEIDTTQLAAQLGEEDVSTIGDVAKGLVAGPINAIAGALSLPAELIDWISLDEGDKGPGLAEGIRDIFDTITPTTRTGAGNAVKFVTQFVVPGTIASKMAAARNLGKLGQIAAFGAADVLATTPDVPTLGDFFEGGPTQRIDTEDLEASERAAANLINRFKVASEGTVLLLGGPAIIKAVAKGTGPVLDKIAKTDMAKAAAEGIRANILDNVGPMASLDNPTFISRNIRNLRNKIRESETGKKAGEMFSAKGRMPTDAAELIRQLKIRQVSLNNKQARSAIEGLTQGLEVLNKNGLLNELDQARILDAINDYIFATKKGKASKETIRANGEKALKEADKLFKQIDNKKLMNKLYGTVNIFGKDKELSLFNSAKAIREKIDELSDVIRKDLPDDDNAFNNALKEVIKENMNFYGRTVYRAGREKNFDPTKVDLKKQEAAVLNIMQNGIASNPKDAMKVLQEILKKVKKENSFSNANMKPKNMFEEDTLNGINTGILKEKTLDSLPAVRDFLGEYTGAKNIYGVVGRTKQKDGSFKNQYGKIREQTLEEQKIGLQFKVSETVSKMSNLIEQKRYYQNLKAHSDALKPQGKEFLFDKQPLDPSVIKANEFEVIGNLKPGKVTDPITGKVTEIPTDESIMRFGDLAGKYVRKEYIRAFSDIPSYINFAEVNKLYATFLGMKGMSQIAKTVYSPITQIRNATTAALFVVKNGNFGNGEDLVSSAKVVFQNINDNIAFSKGSTQFKASEKSLASKQEIKEYYEEMVERGIVNTNSKIGEFEDLLGDATQFGPSNRYVDPILKMAQNTQNRFSGKLYQGSDDIWKIYSYEMELGRLKSSLLKSFGREGVDPSNFKMKAYDVENILKYGDEAVDLKNLNREDALEFLKKESAEIVKDTVPNYSRVPEFIKRLRQYPFGNFIAFPAEVIRTSGNIYGRAIRELASDSPELRSIGMRRLMGSLTVDAALPAGLVTAGLTLTGSTQEQLDAYRRSGAADYDKHSILVPMSTDKNGKLRELYNFSYTNPYDYFTRPARAIYNAVNDGIRSEKELHSIAWDASVDSLSEFFSPFMSESMISEKALDLIRNQTRYGRNVWNEADPLGLRVSKGFAHFSEGLMPGISPIRFKGDVSGQDIQLGSFTFGADIEGFPKALGLAAGLDPSKAVNRQGYRVDAAGEFAEALTGLKSIKPRMENALSYRGWEAGKLVTEASGIFNRIAKSKSGMDPEDSTKAYIVSNAQRFKALRDLNMAIEDARTLGLSEDEIYRALKKAKTPNIDMLMAGKFKPFFPSEETINLAMQEQKDKMANPFNFSDMYKIYGEQYGRSFLPKIEKERQEAQQREIEELFRKAQAVRDQSNQPPEIQIPEPTQPVPAISPGVSALRQVELNKLLGI